MEERLRVVEAARGERAMDLLIEDVRLVNVFTGEIYSSEIGISDGYVVHVGPPTWSGTEPKARCAAAGRFAVPGLVVSSFREDKSFELTKPVGVPRGH